MDEESFETHIVDRVPGEWQGYSVDVDTAQARTLFESKFGYCPLRVVVAGSIVLAGPIVSPELAQPRLGGM